MLLNFYFWQPIYYFLHPEDYKLVDDESGKMICQSVIRSATEPGTANLRVDPIKPLPLDVIRNTEPAAMLDEMMTRADFKTLLSNVDMVDPVDSIPASTKSKTWQEMEQGRQLKHQEDIQQHYFRSYQPKSTENNQHQYQTRSRTSANEVTATPEGKEFGFLRDKGEKIIPVFKKTSLGSRV